MQFDFKLYVECAASALIFPVFPVYQTIWLMVLGTGIIIIIINSHSYVKLYSINACW